jgi:hypothetical protein
MEARRAETLSAPCSCATARLSLYLSDKDALIGELIMMSLRDEMLKGLERGGGCRAARGGPA